MAYHPPPMPSPAASSCRLSALALCLAALPACPRPQVARPYPPPSATQVIAHLEGLRERAATLNAETRTDVRLGNERVNVKVLMLAAWGGKLRFQAQHPNQTMAADLASDGQRYCFLDVDGRCAECGPATADTVARLVRIRLEPDEVVSILLGSAPLLQGGEDAVSWDPDGGREVLTQRRGDEVRRIVLDGRDRRWDVLEAEARVGGQLRWRIRHKDFAEVAAADGKSVRLPKASLFEQADDTVRITWLDQRAGQPLGDASFQLTPPSGLPACGAPR
jgi:hypothetical protein